MEKCKASKWEETGSKRINSMLLIKKTHLDNRENNIKTVLHTRTHKRGRAEKGYWHNQKE